MIYTDLDATFLDVHTYSCRESLRALRAAMAAGVAVVFCSSKTAAEIERLLSELDLSLPFIAENGGGLYIPDDYFLSGLSELPLERKWRVLALGVAYELLVRALIEVRGELGMTMRGFSDMTAEEIAGHCGLSVGEARLAKERRFDEPFVLQSENEAAAEEMRETFARRGLKVTVGGRFHHLTGDNDKGAAVLHLNRLFLEEELEVLTLGIGDSANDLPMLRVVDRPVLVQKPGGEYDGTVAAGLPGILRAPGVGPTGWSKVVMDFVREHS